jgi:hypothetical protein
MDSFAGIGRSPNGNRHVTLQNHMITEEMGKARVGGQRAAEGSEQKQSPSEPIDDT